MLICLLRSMMMRNRYTMEHAQVMTVPLKRQPLFLLEDAPRPRHLAAAAAAAALAAAGLESSQGVARLVESRAAVPPPLLAAL